MARASLKARSVNHALRAELQKASEDLRTLLATTAESSVVGDVMVAVAFQSKALRRVQTRIAMAAHKGATDFAREFKADIDECDELIRERVFHLHRLQCAAFWGQLTPVLEFVANAIDGERVADEGQADASKRLESRDLLKTLASPKQLGLPMCGADDTFHNEHIGALDAFTKLQRALHAFVEGWERCGDASVDIFDEKARALWVGLQCCSTAEARYHATDAIEGFALSFLNHIRKNRVSFLNSLPTTEYWYFKAFAPVRQGSGTYQPPQAAYASPAEKVAKRVNYALDYVGADTYSLNGTILHAGGVEAFRCWPFWSRVRETRSRYSAASTSSEKNGEKGDSTQC